MTTLAPIALFVYNRPTHTRQAIEALQKNILAKESDLFIFSDAPKSAASAEKVHDVREYIRSTSGFRSVSIVERDKNWGLANSIIDGVTKLCNERGRVVVLEDDLLPSVHYLEYMNSALDRYEGDSRVMQVSGHMFPVDLHAPADTIFFPITTTWGWATWQRAWAKFDPDMGNYERLMSNPEMMRRFDLEGAYPCLSMLKSVRAGKLDAWGIRWYLSVFMDDGLVLFPSRSLIENRGFDAEGTNCGQNPNSVLLSQPTGIFRVQSFPHEVKCSEAEFVVLKKHLLVSSRAIGWMPRIWNRILRGLSHSK